MLEDRDVGVLLHPLSCCQLDQRPGHGVRLPSEIALWKRVKSGGFDTQVETHPKRHGSGSGKVLLEAGEKLAERTLAATKEQVRMPRLGRPGSVRRVNRQGVALEHDHLLEMVGK